MRRIWYVLEHLQESVGDGQQEPRHGQRHQEHGDMVIACLDLLVVPAVGLGRVGEERPPAGVQHSC